MGPLPRQEELERAVRAAFTEEAGELLRRVERALQGLVGGATAEREARCLEALRGLHTLKGAAAAAGQEQVKQQSHSLEEQLRRIQSGALPLDRGVMDAVFEAVERLHEALEAGQGSAPPPALEQESSAAPVLARAAFEEVLRVRPERVEALHTLVGDLVSSRLHEEALFRRMVEARELLGAAVGHWRELYARLSLLRRTLAPGPWSSIRAARDGCGPALTGAFQALSAVVREAPQLLSQSAAVSASLEEGVRELQLMPLQPFFEEYTRVVREAAREQGKGVRLEIRAEGAEIDRVVLMRLREPLLHLVRNAVVHGVERPEVRRSRGKPEEGSLTIEARCEGARVLIRIADDGAGIDVGRVRRRAQEAGLLEIRRELDEDGLLALLSHPGFSTREEADALAGRGIGLDVVASTLHELDGHLRLEHTPGVGTAFLLEVPITSSIHQGLRVQAAGEEFGILLHHVERLIRVDAGMIQQVAGQSTVLLEAEPAAVVTLAGLLGLEPRGSGGRRRPAVVLRQGRQRLAVLVDDALGEQRMVIKPLPPAFSRSPLVLGGTVQPDGTVLPVLHVSGLFERAAQQPHAGDARAVLPEARDTRRSFVLVVDDSLTMRAFLRSVLQGAGYEVEVACDGAAALEAFQRRPHDLVITDLQMPRLDGVGVCQAIRRSARPRTPVLLVTSVGAVAEHHRALEAGANACLIKNQFEQDRFLRLVGELAGFGSRSA